jgi:hypothetical protein
MAKMCENGCHIICDFCIYYKDNYEDNEFCGEGICTKTNTETSFSGACEEFECFNYRKGE